MTTLESLRTELADLSHVLDAFVTADIPERSPEWVAMQGLLRRQADLQHELRLLEGTADLEVTLVGGAEHTHGIEADFLGGFISEVQAAVAAVTQTLMRGERGSRGTYAKKVVGASNLQVSATAPGSFVLRMDGPRDRASQFTMEGTEQLPPFDEAVQKIRDVLSASQSGDMTALRTAIVEVGSHRALLHVGQIARALARSKTNASVVQRSEFFEGPQEARMTPTGAERLQDVLSRTDQTTTTVRVAGRLSGVLWRRGFFELESAAGVISGRVVAELRETVQQHFDRDVDADLERTVTTEAGKQVRVTHRLVGIDTVPTLDLAPSERAGERRANLLPRPLDRD
jgi:hypothetical protein